MKTSLAFGFLFAAAGVVAAKPVSAAAALTVHEWGTFTTVSGSDGRLLPGLQVEEQSLPAFVHSLGGFVPGTKGMTRPVENVTVKMETPVIYFYSEKACEVRVDVGFNGGSISQWYPERSGGEASLTAPAIIGLAGDVLKGRDPAIDFAKGYRGSASWRVDVLAHATPEKISSHEIEGPQWPRARIAGANKVRGPGQNPEVEGFIFYRGVGNFTLPLTTSVDSEGRLHLRNSGRETIPFTFVYDKRPGAPAMVWWRGPLAAGEIREVLLPDILRDYAGATPTLKEAFPRALQAAGLSTAEAAALLATWRESYFEREGLRVFWIVPRAFTDSVLPITITPRPEKLERVLVGRSEVLTPAFEAELGRDFAADGGKRWMSDRYYAAYLARAKQRGVVLHAAHP